MNNMIEKLVYVLPEASSKTHMKYNVEFLESLVKEKSVDIFLILERGINGDVSAELEKIKINTGINKIFYTGNTNSILRILKLYFALYYARILGYRKVYVHYSFIAVLVSKIIFPRFTVFYWNCGLPWKFKRPFFQDLYETIAYKILDYFVSGTTGLVKAYSKYYNFSENKNIVIPNWIDVEGSRKNNLLTSKAEFRKSKGFKENDLILFFNQRLAERKGAHFIIDILKNTKENVKLIVTNDGPYKERLKEEIAQHNFLERVVLLGRITNKEVLGIMSMVDIYVLPSLEEGMSHSLMEAFVFAVPAVAFDVGGTKEMFPEAYKNYVVESGNIEHFCKVLNQLINSQADRDALGQAVYEKVKEYDKKIVLNTFIKMVVKMV